jgi:hypothetical protein
MDNLCGHAYQSEAGACRGYPKSPAVAKKAREQASGNRKRGGSNQIADLQKYKMSQQNARGESGKRQ